MILLGIDPGCRFAGYSVIKKESAKVYLLDYGYLRLSPTKSLPERVYLFHNFFHEKVLKWNATDLALETPFLGKNAQTFLKLGYLRGALYLISQKHQLHLHEYSPREVKEAITGFGGATKIQVSRVLLQLFPRINAFEKEDVSDALAVTLCALWRAPSKNP